MPRFHKVQRPLLLSDAHSRLTRPPNISPDSGAGVLRSVGRSFFFHPLSAHIYTTISSLVRFLITWEAVEHAGPYVLHLPAIFLPDPQLTRNTPIQWRL
jgi:hypothetical protein